MSHHLSTRLTLFVPRHTVTDIHLCSDDDEDTASSLPHTHGFSLSFPLRTVYPSK